MFAYVTKNMPSSDCFTQTKAKMVARLKPEFLFRRQIDFFVAFVDQVPLHSKSLCKIMTRASGGANNMRTLNWGGSNGKDPFLYCFSI